MQIDMSSFLKWANDKISVVWSYGCEQLIYFNPDLSEDVGDFLNRIIDYVGEYDDHIFYFSNENLDASFNEYQNQTYDPVELLEIYKKTYDCPKRVNKRAREDESDIDNDIHDNEQTLVEYIWMNENEVKGYDNNNNNYYWINHEEGYDNSNYYSELIFSNEEGLFENKIVK